MLSEGSLEVRKELIMLLRPDVTDKDIENVKVRLQYDWVILKSNKISIGMRLKHDLWGMGHKLSAFEEIVRSGRFKAWKFYDDHKYQNSEGQVDITDLLKKYNVPRPSAEQMFKYYYED